MNFDGTRNSQQVRPEVRSAYTPFNTPVYPVHFRARIVTHAAAAAVAAAAHNSSGFYVNGRHHRTYICLHK